MHHFTLRKMKKKDPQQLSFMLQKFILSPDKPSSLPHKPRAAKGSRKKRNQIAFTRTQLERMLNFARLTGDKEMVGLLSPRKSLPAVKRELIASIRHGKVDNDLWQTYSECIKTLQERPEEEFADS